MSKKNKLRRKATRKLTVWHRRIGVFSALFIVILSVTGVLLNHTSRFNLDSNFISFPWVLSLYSVATPQISSVSLGDDWVSEVESKLFYNAKPLGECRGRLLNALIVSEYWLIACSEQIILYSNDHMVIEKIDGATGLPVPLQGFSQCGSGACMMAASQIYKIDTNALSWSKLTEKHAFDLSWNNHTPAPKHIIESLKAKTQSKIITWEKLVLDIHAGRYFGAAGPLVMDFVAFIFIILAFSGIYMWGAKLKK